MVTEIIENTTKHLKFFKGKITLSSVTLGASIMLYAFQIRDWERTEGSGAYFFTVKCLLIDFVFCS
jgi:hypothetical protein